MSVAPGYALIDTGAQHGVLGPSSNNHICDVLARFGLKPGEVPTLKMNAVGIGGSSAFQKSAEIPVGIAGVSGTLTIHVVPQEIPLLIPVGFLRKLGMILDLPEMTITWKNLAKKTSEVHEVGNAPHLAIDLFQFPTKTLWKNPHDDRKSINVSEHSADYSIPRSAFELHPSNTNGPAAVGSKILSNP